MPYKVIKKSFIAHFYELIGNVEKSEFKLTEIYVFLLVNLERENILFKNKRSDSLPIHFVLPEQLSPNDGR